MATMELDETALGVFMGSDGAICHAVCWAPLQYVGVRGGLEVAFYCPDCVEHLSLPMRRIPGIPMRSSTTVARRGPQTFDARAAWQA